MKTEIILGLLLVMSAVGAGKPSFDIKQSCSGSEEPLFSMYSKNGGNIGTPGHYKWNVCASDVKYTSIKQSCSEDENRILSMYKKNDSHASIYAPYSWSICAPKLATELKRSCSNPIASLYSEHDTNVAAPGHFKWKLCPFRDITPQNVTLEVRTSADNAVVSGDGAEEKIYSELEVSYPYIVGETGNHTKGIVSYGDFRSLAYRSGGKKIFNVTQADAGSFLVPFTRGDRSVIENREDAVLQNRFLESFSPSFASFNTGGQTVKVALDAPYRTYGFAGEETQSLDIAVRNRLDGDNFTDIEFRLQ